MALAAGGEEKLSGPDRAELRQVYLLRYDEPYRRAASEQAEIEASRRVIRRHSPITLVMQEKTDSEPTAHVLFRGQYDQPKDEVHAQTPAFLPPIPKGAAQSHGAGDVARRSGQPADRPCDDQSLLGATVWRWDRSYRRRFWDYGRKPNPSHAARLARGGFRKPAQAGHNPGTSSE